jgi:hypothetical protein
MAISKVALTASPNILKFDNTGGMIPASGSSNTPSSTELWVHIQNFEIMYERTNQYKSLDGTPDFNYIDCNYIIEVAEETLYANASSGDYYQVHQFDLISDSPTGGLGTCGVVRTSQAGYVRRALQATDTTGKQRSTGNMITGKFPGQYTLAAASGAFDTSSTAGGTVFDMVLTASRDTDRFDLSLLEL